MDAPMNEASMNNADKNILTRVQDLKKIPVGKIETHVVLPEERNLYAIRFNDGLVIDHTCFENLDV